ncbi:hypothetical protein NC651_024533 [Populus alba x Populus x berolinensis]|nr:hypothetical protein NC651_024533 [Populus alba x Populus x berolinensis]
MIHEWYMISNTSHRDMVLSEVQKHRKYRQHILSNYKVPYNLSEHHEQFGVVLDDSGLETMLEKLMDDYLCPMSRVFFHRVGGLTLDSHHGSVVEYREHMDIELSRKILIITTFRDEQFFIMVAIGHGARATISGHQVNLVIWCRSCIAFLLESCELDLILLLMVWCSVSVKVGAVCQIGCHIYVNNSSEKLTLFLFSFLFLALFSSVFQEPKKHLNDFSAGVEIVDARKKKDNACQTLLQTGIAEEGWYFGILSH